MKGNAEEVFKYKISLLTRYEEIANNFREKELEIQTLKQNVIDIRKHCVRKERQWKLGQSTSTKNRPTIGRKKKKRHIRSQ